MHSSTSPARNLANSADRGPGALKRFRQRPGSVDFDPFDAAQRERLLLKRNGRIGVGGVETARPDAIEPYLKICNQKQPAKSESADAAIASTSARSSGFANTASTMAEWCAARTRAALSATIP